MAVASNSINFLNLAYLLEFSLVLNLTFRELKFPELHSRLKEDVVKIYHKFIKSYTIAEVSPDELKSYPELKQLESLINPEEKIDINNHAKNIWKGQAVQRYFFQYFIKKRYGLKIVNINILITFLLLLACTLISDQSISGWYFDIPNEASKNDLDHIEDGIRSTWWVMLAASFILCAIPLGFIRLGTVCEKFFYGVNGNNGVVRELESDMRIRKPLVFIKKKNNVKKNSDAANRFSAPQTGTTDEPENNP